MNRTLGTLGTLGATGAAGAGCRQGMASTCGPGDANANANANAQALGAVPLRRHRLAHPDAATWAQALRQAPDAQALACLRHWAEHDLPLVVTRQPLATPQAPNTAGSAERCRGAAALHPTTAPRPGSAAAPLDGSEGAPLGGSTSAPLGGVTSAPLGGITSAPLALGLPAPTQWGRRPLSLWLPAAQVARWAEFPSLAQVCPLLPAATHAALARLVQGLADLGVSARAYGSAGWQCLSGLAYLHPQSDLDLWLAVADACQADAAAATLQAATPPGLALDGELVFPDGAAVAWREWSAWRAGRTQHLLVKRLRTVALAATPGDLGLAGLEKPAAGAPAAGPARLECWA